MSMLTVRGNSFHKQRHSCPHSFSPGFFRSVISSLFFPFFLYKLLCSVQRQRFAVKGLKSASVSVQHQEEILMLALLCKSGEMVPGSWVLGRGGGRQLCRVYRRTHAVRTAPRIFKKSTIHHLTPAITMTRPRKNTLDYQRHLHDTGELRHRSGGSAWPSNSSLLRNPLCSPSGLNERVLSPVTPVY